MTSQESDNCEKLRAPFQGREAVYIEEGVPRARVENSRFDADSRTLDADVEEVPAPGLEHSSFHMPAHRTNQASFDGASVRGHGPTRPCS